MSSTVRWSLGLCIASIFSLVYLLTPVYVLSAIAFLCLQYPCKHAAFIYAAPLFISILIPCRPMLWLAPYMTSMLDYFDYDEVLEISNDECLKLANSGKNFILALQPHGVISFVSLCAWVNAPPEVRCVQTAVASVLLKTPILKNVMGIYGLTAASSGNMKRILQTRLGIGSCIVLYIGGIAELFKTCNTEERLYLKKRKGTCVKLTGSTLMFVMPLYLWINILFTLSSRFYQNCFARGCRYYTSLFIR